MTAIPLQRTHTGREQTTWSEHNLLRIGPKAPGPTQKPPKAKAQTLRSSTHCRRCGDSAKMAAILRKSPTLTSFNPVLERTSHRRCINSPSLVLFQTNASKIQFPCFSHRLGGMGCLGFGGGLGRNESAVDFVRVGAVSDAGPGGGGGFGGGNDGNPGGGSGGDGGDSGENNSSFLSW